MKRATLPILFLSFICFALCSCASMTPNTEHRAICNTLKSQLVFSGATSISRTADIQRSEEPLQAYNYDEDCENK